MRLKVHDYYLNRWHYTHGITAMEPRMVEAEYVCKWCGKKCYDHPARGGAAEHWYETHYADLYWKGQFDE